MSLDFPIRGKRDNYSGKDPKKIKKAQEFNQLAEAIEKHVNDQIKNGKRGVFSYNVIGIEAFIDPKIVSKVLYCVSGGDNGFTVPDDIKIC